MARVTISARGVRQLMAPGGDLDRFVERVAEEAADRARYHLQHQGIHRHYKIPSDLRIEVRRAGALRGQGIQYRVVATGRLLANIYEFGSEPHVIPASPTLVFNSRKLRKKVIVRKPSGAQRSPSGGYRTLNFKNTVVTYKGHVNHPGTKAIRYMEKALRDVSVRSGVLR